jgi:hypothetical protein
LRWRIKTGISRSLLNREAHRALPRRRRRS